MGVACQICDDKAIARCGKCYGFFCGIHVVDAPYGRGTMRVCLDCADKVKQGYQFHKKVLIIFIISTFSITIVVMLIIFLVIPLLY